MKKELTEKSIETYVSYLTEIRLCYGTECYLEHLKRVLNGIKYTYSVDIKKLRSDLLHLVDDEYNKRLLVLNK